MEAAGGSIMKLTERQRIAHLLRRTGLSASKTEIDQYLPLGVQGTIEALLDFDKQPEEFNDDEIVTLLRADAPNLRPPIVTDWWTYRMLMTRRPLQERLALFWHNHFATSASKVQRGEFLLMQIQMFQRMGISNFHDLVLEVSRDPAMLVWLDGISNVKGKPNENYARELLELFTMGIGNYTEQDIKEAARAFTGWTVRRLNGSFFFNAGQHDDSEKVFLGQQGSFGGEDIVRMAVEHPATARFISEKFYLGFIADAPDKKAIDALAKTFRESNYDIKALLRRILTSETFWSEKAYRKRIKSPVEFIIGTLRQMGLPERLREANLQTPQGQRMARTFLRLAGSLMRKMGQMPLYPPSVKGWDGGTAWISSATMLERMRFADVLTGSMMGSGGGRAVRPMLLNLNSLSGETPATDLEVFSQSLQTTMDVELSRSTQQRLQGYLESKGGMETLESRDRAIINGALKIIFASPEYQFV
jgi:hypothetical protein